MFCVLQLSKWYLLMTSYLNSFLDFHGMSNTVLFLSLTATSYSSNKGWSSTGSLLDPLLFVLCILFLDRLTHICCSIGNSQISLSRPDFCFQTHVPHYLSQFLPVVSKTARIQPYQVHDPSPLAPLKKPPPTSPSCITPPLSV